MPGVVRSRPSGEGFGKGFYDTRFSNAARPGKDEETGGLEGGEYPVCGTPGNFMFAAYLFDRLRYRNGGIRRPSESEPLGEFLKIGENDRVGMADFPEDVGS